MNVIQENICVEVVLFWGQIKWVNLGINKNKKKDDTIC